MLAVHLFPHGGDRHSKEFQERSSDLLKARECGLGRKIREIRYFFRASHDHACALERAADLLHGTRIPTATLAQFAVCTRWGMIGADVRPDWSPHVNKPRV